MLSLRKFLMTQTIMLIVFQANRTVVNKYFGKGVPDYDAVSKNKGKWVIQVQGDG